MAFNKNDPAQVSALKNEITLDPIAMGYDIDRVNVGLKLINDPANNLGGDTVEEMLTVAMLLDVVDMGDFDSNQVSDGERRFIESFLNRDLNQDIDRWKVKIRSAFKINSTTAQAIAALVRPISRATVLFGANTNLVKEDWFAARDS